MPAVVREWASGIILCEHDNNFILCKRCKREKMLAKREKTMKTKQNEAGILRACQDLLTAERIPWYRMQSGKIILKNGNGTRRAIKLNPEGTPDLLCHYTRGIPFHGWYQIVWIETKAPGKEPSDTQRAFRNAAVDRGELWLKITDVKQLQDWLKEMRNGA